MAAAFLRTTLRRLTSLSTRRILANPQPIFTPATTQLQNHYRNNIPLSRQWRRSFNHGSVSLVISPEGKPVFETRETEPPTKEKWKTKKRFKQQKMREKKKRKAANKRDPRRIGVGGNKKKRQRFDTAEERIKYKIANAKIKEGLLIERLKRYEVPKAEGPVVEPHILTGEERFYMKKMAQKRSNYVPVGRRGVFGGVILNMHLHWKKHETVKVICKPCRPGQIQEYANEIARLSGGIPIQTIGDNEIIFYRGKNYVQPDVMSPVDTLSKKRALEKSKYEQSLDSVRFFIAKAETELEHYYRHIALYGDPNDRDPKSILDRPRNKNKLMINDVSTTNGSASEEETGYNDQANSETEDNFELSELDSEDDVFSEESVSSDEIAEESSSEIREGVVTESGLPSFFQCKVSYNESMR